MNRPIATPAEIRTLRAAGWRIEKAPGNKMRWVSPGGEILVSGRFVRNCRSLKNHAARMKRAAQPSARAYN